MACKWQHKHQGLSPVEGRYPAQRAFTTSNDRADAIATAKTIEELVAPAFSSPFTVTYTSELKISDFEDMLGIIAEITVQTAAQDQKYLNHENQIQYSYTTVARPWDQQSQIQQVNYSSRNQTPFAVGENQAPVEEPFNDVGEVAFKSRNKQNKNYNKKLRHGKRRAFELRYNRNFQGGLW